MDEFSRLLGKGLGILLYHFAVFLYHSIHSGVVLVRRAVGWEPATHPLVLGEWPETPFVKSPYMVAGARRFEHLSVMGATGSGKTVLLTNLIVQDIASGAGVCVIDPKDSLIDDVLAHLPAEREQDVIILDPTDTERPVGFNPLSGIPPARHTLATNELISAFKRYFEGSWGPRLEFTLTNAILALLETPHSSLIDIPFLMQDAAFRARVLRRVTNPAVHRFWSVTWEQAGGRSEMQDPILNKIGPWLTYPELRNIIAQPRSSFAMRDVLDRGKILLVRLPKGTLGETLSALLGALIVAKIELAAQNRAEIPTERRRPFFLYVDEFQNFATSSFDRIITEARGFKLGLICANQFAEQLSPELLKSIAHNVGVAVLCTSHPYRLHVAPLETRRNGAPPLELTPYPPALDGDRRRVAYLKAASRLRYGRERKDVESQILKGWGVSREKADWTSDQYEQ